MPSYSNEMTLTYGDDTSAGGVPCREVVNFSFDYENENLKRILVAAGTTDQAIDLSDLTDPKVIIVSSLEADFTVKLGDGTVGEEASLPEISVSEEGGSLVLQNPNGLGLTTIYVTTAASPTSGARVRIAAFE